MRRLAILVAAVALLSSLAVLGSPAPAAHACSRVDSDTYAAADFVVEGTVVDIQPLAGAPDRARATVAVDRTLKGPARQSVMVGAPRVTSPAACAYAFELGGRYRVFGHADGRTAGIDGWACGCWGPMAVTRAAETHTATAPGVDRRTYPIGPVVALGVATLAVLALAAAMVVRQRRRAQ